nr:hypothetical protein [Tanacetum cinerariifolium]
NDHNKLLAFCGRDVSEGKCAGLIGKKPKIVDNEECETSKQGSKKGYGRKAVNEIISKVVKESDAVGCNAEVLQSFYAKCLIVVV